MNLNPIPDIAFYLLVPIILMTGLNAKALGVGIIATLAVLSATQIQQFEIIMLAWVMGYFLSNFRD